MPKRTSAPASVARESAASGAHSGTLPWPARLPTIRINRAPGMGSGTPAALMDSSTLSAGGQGSQRRLAGLALAEPRPSTGGCLRSAGGVGGYGGWAEADKLVVPARPAHRRRHQGSLPMAELAD